MRAVKCVLSDVSRIDEFGILTSCFGSFIVGVINSGTFNKEVSKELIHKTFESLIHNISFYWEKKHNEELVIDIRSRK